MTTYSNLKYDHPFSTNATGTGSLTLISSQTASASASISFTSGIDSTYDEYIFKFINFNPADDGYQLAFQGSTDGGSNYNTTITSSFIIVNNNEAGTDTGLGLATSFDQAQGTAFQQLTHFIGNGADESASGYLHIFEPSSTTFVKHFISSFNTYHYQDYCMTSHVAGYFNTTSALNAFQFKSVSGNFDGTILMYGVK